MNKSKIENRPLEQVLNSIPNAQAIPSASHRNNTMLADAVFRPMLYSEPMVEACLQGTKNQTRRLQGLESVNNSMDIFNWEFQVIVEPMAYFKAGQPFTDAWAKEKTRLNKGDIVWVRESFFAWGHWTTISENGKSKKVFQDLTTDRHLVYRYFNTKPEKVSKVGELGWHKRPSLFMPKSACRMWQKVKNVRIERLQDISENDAKNEGIFNAFRNIDTEATAYRNYLDKKGGWDSAANSAIHSYQTLWVKINGQDSWNANPWVFVYEFEVIRDVPFGFR